MNKKGFVSIALAIAVILMTGAGVAVYRHKNSANILELAGNMENGRKVVSPNELPLAGQKETVKTEPRTANVWEKVIQEQKTTKEKTNQGNQILQEQKREPYIKVISPNGGENWKNGKTYDIVWESEGIDKINVMLSDVDDYTDEVITGPIASNIPASNGRYSWTISSSDWINHGLKIRISGASQSGGNFKVDLSDNYFTVVNEDLSLLDHWETYESQDYGIRFKYPEGAMQEADMVAFEDSDPKQSMVLIMLPDSYEDVIKKAVILFDKDVAENFFSETVEKKKRWEIVYVKDVEFNKESGIRESGEDHTVYYEKYSTVNKGQYFCVIFTVGVNNPLGHMDGYNPYSEFYTFNYIIRSVEFFDKKSKEPEKAQDDIQYWGHTLDTTCPVMTKIGWSCFGYREDGECKFMCTQYSASKADTDFLLSSFEDLMNYHTVDYDIDTEKYSVYNDNRFYPEINASRNRGEDRETGTCYSSTPCYRENFDKLKNFFERLKNLLKNAQSVDCLPWRGKEDDSQSEVYKDHLVFQINNFDRSQGSSFDYSIEIDFTLKGEKKNTYFVDLRIGDHYCYEGQADASFLNSFLRDIGNFANSIIDK